MAFLIKNGRIYTMEGRVFQRGYILCENGIIADVGDMADCPCDIADTLTLDGEYVLPGLIDAHTHAGLFADSMPFDINDSGVSRPSFCSADALSPGERAFSDALRNGITAVVVSPCSDAPVTGQLSALRTDGTESPLTACAGFKFSLGENPKVSKDYPDAESEIRASLLKNRDVFLSLFERTVPAVFHCHSEEDIRAAIRISEDFNLRYILVHATDSGLMLDELSELQANIITGPILTTRSKPEMKNLSDLQFFNLVQKGLSPCICSDYPELPAEHLMLYAALAAKEGVCDTDAFSAVTITPAKMFGLDDRIGSIRPGKSCDLVIYAGHPFDLRSKIKHVYSCGKRIF